MDAASAVLGWVLACAAVIPLILQFRHVIRTGSVAGLSFSSACAWTVSWGVWAVYGYFIESWPLVATGLIGLLVQGVLCGFIFRAGHGKVMYAAVWLVVGVGCVLVSIPWGWEATALAITIVDVVGLAPQFVAALREDDLAGLSRSSYVTWAVESAGWIVYALAIGHPLAAGASLAAFPMTVIVLYSIHRKTRTREI